MRITVVVAVYPPEPEPAAVMANELVHHWSKLGHNVTVICPFPNRPRGRVYEGFKRRLWHKTVDGNLRIIRVWTWLIGSRRRFLNRILENASFGASSALALLFLSRPDVLIVESWPVLAPFIAAGAAKLRGIPMIHYIQDVYPEAMIAAGILPRGGLLEKGMLKMDTAVCRHAARCVTISDSMREVLVETRGLPREKVSVIRNWLDLGKIQPYQGDNRWRSGAGIAAHETVFMFGGTMGYASGVDILVEVADLLWDTRGIRIVCVGEGHLKSVLIREKEGRNLANLTILDFQPRERVSEMQSSADVMLLITSKDMGLSSVPSKLITYLAVGKPVLCAVAESSDIAALVRQEDVGIVVPPGDAAKIRDAILEFVGMTQGQRQQKGEKAREVAVRLFSTQRAFGEFDALIAAEGRERRFTPPRGLSRGAARAETPMV